MTSHGKTMLSDLNDDQTAPPQPTPPTILPPLPLPTPDTDSGDDSVVEKGNPTIEFLGYQLDVDSSVIMIASVAIWVFIWNSTGLLQNVGRDWSYLAIFSFFIIYTAINMFTSGSKSGSVLYELNILLTVEQMIAIMFGTVIVFIIFNDKLMIHPVAKQIINKLGFAIVILLSFASMWINVITSGRAFRAIRKGKQGLYNIAYCLFIVIGLMAFKSSEPFVLVK